MSDDSHREAGIEFAACQSGGLPVRPTLLPLYPIFDDIVGSTPENPGVAPGSVLTIAQRTRDVSSNEITILDISNLYYGNKIKSYKKIN